MNYILIDNFNDNINIICKDDGSGETLIFDSFEKANEELEEQCQNGIVVPLTDIISILKRCSAFIDVIKFEEGEDIDETNLESAINNIIY